MKTIKKTVAAAVAALSFACVAFAETLDHWELSAGSMTDGEWTFTVGRRVNEPEVAEGIFGLWVTGCTGTPSSPALLDFGKPISEYDGKKHAITVINSADSKDWLSADQKAAIGRLALPTNLSFKLNQYTFYNCTNLVEVKPFLGDCCTAIKRGVFQGCSQLTNALICKVTTPLSDTSSSGWEIFDGCSKIPSADLSQSALTSIARHFFYNCSSIEVLKLPASMCRLADGRNDAFFGMTSLRRVEMHSSVDGFLNMFPKGTTALSEIHFYNCLPNETNSVLTGIAASQVVTTYLHDMTDDQLIEWAKCTEGGALTTTSTWSKKLATEAAYLNRPLVVYAPQHAQIAAGVDASVLDGQDGTFTVSRGDSDPCSGDLVVNYEVSGEAVAGTHYVALSGSVTIPNGQASAVVSVTGRYIGEAFEKELTLTLTSGDYEIIEGKESASISVISGYRSVSAVKIKDANKQLGQVGTFRVSRGDGDSTSVDLDVTLGYSGTATNGTTYRELPTSVTIPAGKQYVDFEIFPLDDTSVKTDSQAIITVKSGLYTPAGDPAQVEIVYGNGKWGVWHIIDDSGTKKITDGVWTFNVSLSGSKVSTGDAYRMEVQTATECPAAVSPLDFTKGTYYVFGDRTYKINTWNMAFGDANGTPTAAGEKVGRVTLSGGAHTVTISAKAFAGCTNMVFDLATLPTNIITIGSYAFKNSSVSGTLSSPCLSSIESDAFRACTNDLSLAATNIMTIGMNAFRDATGLKSVDLGTDEGCVLSTIGAQAFLGCTALESFSPFLPSNCVSIGQSAFQSCSKLKQPLVLHKKQIENGDYIFDGCGVSSIDFDDSTVTILGRGAFARCTNLITVELPSTLESLNAVVGSFAGCANLEQVVFHSVPTNGLNNGFCHTYESTWAADDNLTEAHFYNCAPTNTPAYWVFNNVANGKILTTYLHDMTANQLQLWGEYCAEGDAITRTSTWKQGLVGAKIYQSRPLVEYSEQHAQIAAGANVVVLDGQNGTFTVSRGDDDSCAGDLVVNYTACGAAVAGTDYVALSGTVTILNGESNATISVSGIYTGEKLPKDLTLTLTPSADYKIIEGKTNATISVFSGYRGVSVTNLVDANKQQGKVGSFRVSRGENDSTEDDFVVALEYSGTATNGTTYGNLPASVTIPAGQKYVDFEVIPLDDEGVTTDSTVIVSISKGLYTKESGSATVTIYNNGGAWGCWRIIEDGTKITDGTWTFGCKLKTNGGVFSMDVNAATDCPDKVSPLDFTKGSYYVFNNNTYKIYTWNMKFGEVVSSGLKRTVTLTEAGKKVGAITLSGGTHTAAISDDTFAGCTNAVFNLSNLPTNITTIGSCAFLDASVSGTLSAPYLTTIKGHAFRRCVGNISIATPKITRIEDYAFNAVTGLKSVDLGPDAECALTYIGASAFQDCTALESFTPFLPSSLDVLNARGAFENCENLTNALVFTGSSFGESATSGGSAEVFYGCKKIPSADLSGSTITALCRDVFRDCDSLEWVKLPPTFNVFGCLNYGLTDRPWYDVNPFRGDNMSVKLYVTGTTLPNHDIDISGVTAIEFATNLTVIADGAFASTNYSGITELKFCGAKPATIGEDLFAGRKDETITAYVPFRHVESWKDVADGRIITSTSGTWTSGTTQKIRIKRGLVIIMD